jgi:hypothetical protein
MGNREDRLAASVKCQCGCGMKLHNPKRRFRPGHNQWNGKQNQREHSKIQNEWRTR